MSRLGRAEKDAIVFALATHHLTGCGVTAHVRGSAFRPGVYQFIHTYCDLGDDVVVDASGQHSKKELLKSLNLSNSIAIWSNKIDHILDFISDEDAEEVQRQVPERVQVIQSAYPWLMDLSLKRA